MVLTQLAGAMPVDVMPGASDPASHSLPQQPLHHCLFPGAAAFPTLCRYDCHTHPPSQPARLSLPAILCFSQVTASTYRNIRTAISNPPASMSSAYSRCSCHKASHRCDKPHTGTWRRFLTW